MAWVPHGQRADRTKWRFDVAQKSFIPPGTPSGPKGTQVEMPMTYRGNEPTGFHMVASPSGTQAPIEHINYTPETGEVHGRGQAAPPDKLNYTLMPQESLQPNGPASPAMQPMPNTSSAPPPMEPMPNTSSAPPAMEPMGAGAAVPTLGAMGSPSQFAGTPPLASSPTMAGPSPTTAASMPQWGGGGTPFASRMGMGTQMGAGDDVFTNDDPSQPGGQTQPAPDQGGGTPAPAAPAAPAPAANIIAPPQKGYPDGVPRGTPKNEDGTYAYPGQAIPIHGEIGVIGYRVYDGLDEFRQPKWTHSNGPTNASEKDRYQSFDNNDGTVTVVDYSQNPPTVTKRGTQEPGVAAKAAADAAKQQLENRKLQLEIDSKNATNDSDRAKAELELKKLALDIQKADSDAAKAAIEAGLAGKATPKAPDATIVDKSGQVYNLNPDTNHYDPTGVYKSSGTWTPYDDPKTQTHRLFNPDTGEDVELAPMDPYKEYPPQKSTDGSGKWIQWDPGSKAYKTVYTETPDSSTQWSGDELIKVDKATGAVTPIWTKKQTVAEKDAHEAAIDAHNTALQSLEKTKQDLVTGRVTAAAARVTMEKDLQDILHPKPMFSAQGDVFAPPGLTLNMQDWNPITGERGTRTISGGPVDPRVDKMMAEMDAFMAGTGPAPTTTKPDAAKAPFDTSGTQQPDPVKRVDTTGGRQAATNTAPGERDASVGGQMGGQDIRPGYPGWDPTHLGGAAQPPTNRTTSSGDIAHYDENGVLTGIDYRNTAPPGYVEDQAQQDQGDPNEYIGEGMGNGHMGAGMAAGSTGWAPRPGVFAPATGPGFLGAGAEEQGFYDADGTPMDVGAGAVAAPRPLVPTTSAAPGPAPANDKDTNDVLDRINQILGTTTMPLPVPGGHAPPITLPTPNFPHGPQGEVKPPGPSINVAPKPDKGITDEGAQWNPDLKDIVTSKVNEPLKKLLGWPKLEHVPPEDEGAPPTGTQGGFDQPEIDPINIKTGENFPPQEPSDWGGHPDVKDSSHIMGEGGTGPDDWADIQNDEGMASGAGKNVDPEMQRILDEYRQQNQTLGVGAEGDTLDTPGLPPSGQVPPQGSGGQQPPQWLLTLLQAHPELLKMMGMPGAPTGGAPPTGTPTPPAVGAVGGGAPTAGWTPPDQGAPTPPPTPGAPPTGAPPTPGAPPTGGAPSPDAPTAPSPEGAPMTPPVDPSDVAGIGHRYGQDMNVGEPQHSGVDLQAPEGTPTKSPVDGFVTRVEDNPDGLGNTVVIQGMDGSEHRLGHLQSVTAYPGQQVKMGQDLGSPVGDTGMTTGAHLHWGVRDGKGKPADPTPALGPMANMPPVPGTEMMGPPGGVGGSAQQGAPQMGGGQEPERLIPGFSRAERGLKHMAPSSYAPQDQSSGGGSERSLLDLERLGPVSINPMDAFGTGQEKAGWRPRVGAGASNQMFNPMGATDDLGNKLESQARTMSVGKMMIDYTTPAGGRGAMPQPQPSPFQQQPQGGGPGGQQGQGLPAQQGNASSFAEAGAMPMRSQQPQQQQAPPQAQPGMGGGQERYGAGAAPTPLTPPTVPPVGPGWKPNSIPPGPTMPMPPPMPQSQGIQAGAIGQQMAGSLASKGGPMPPGMSGPRTSQPAPQGEQNPALAQPGSGQEKKGKGKAKRKKAGWRPRYGAGQTPPNMQPMQGQPPMQGQQPPMGGDAQSMMQQLLQQQFQQMLAQNRQGQGQPQMASAGAPR